MDRYFVILLICATVLLGIVVTAYFANLVLQKKKQNENHNEKQALKLAYQKKLLEERERTMCEIGAELHDNTAQLMSMARRILSDAMYEVKDAVPSNLLLKTGDLLNEIADQINYLGHSLNSNYLKNLGLPGAITSELEYIGSSGKIACDLILEGDYTPPEFEKELLMYRIIQEAVHNTLKHAQATELILSIHCAADKFMIEVSDNGIGYDINTTMKKGIGISNMFQRAQMLKGILTRTSEAGRGTKVSLEVPLHD